MAIRDYFVAGRELAEKTLARERTEVRSRFFRMTRPRKQPTVTADELLTLDEPLALGRLEEEIGRHGPAEVARALGVEEW